MIIFLLTPSLCCCRLPTCTVACCELWMPSSSLSPSSPVALISTALADLM